MTRSVAVLLLCIIGTTLPVTSQDLRTNVAVADALHLLDVWFDAQRDYDRIPGLSVGVVHDQELLWSNGYGFADAEKKTPAAPSTIYSICSISKLFTAIGVMQLRDQGRLRLDDPVERLLPWFAIKQRYPEAGPATVKGILTHSSGLPRESDYPYWVGPDFRFPTREEIVKKLSDQETLYPADTYFQYSNLGLTLAGEIVAEVSGQPYDLYVRDNILNPLGMKDTRPEMPAQEQGKRLAAGYSALTRSGERNRLPFFRANAVAPAAGFSSTVEDLARFASWQFRLLRNNGTEILDANTLREMHRPQWLDPDWKTARGLGFSLTRHGDKTFVGHEGSCPGYRTALRIHVKDRIAAVFMANASGLDAGNYAVRIYDVVAPAIRQAVKGEKGKEHNPAFDAFTGAYSVEPWGGEMAVMHWEGGLVVIDLPTMDPMDAMTRLKHIEGNTFRRIREDEELGEEVVFEGLKEGKATHLRWHSNPYPRIAR